MATTPTPSPVSPTPPPKSGGTRSLLWWIIGLVVASTLILGLGTALVAFYLAREVKVIRTGQEGVEIRTPAGTFRAEKGGPQKTGLPEYPGARMTETPATVEIAGPIAGELALDNEGGFLVTAAKYRTAATLSAVDEWYRGQLASTFEREPAGIMVRKRRIFGTDVRSDDLAYIEEKDDVIRFVVIRRHLTETEIVLARIGKQEVQ